MSVLQNKINETRYHSIVNKWIKMCKQYELNAEGNAEAQIPQENAFALEIIDFVLDSLVMTKEKPSTIAKELFEFAGIFFYGQSEHKDDYNYLDFDEASIFNKITTKNFEKITQVQIETIIKSLERARKKFV